MTAHRRSPVRISLAGAVRTSPAITDREATALPTSFTVDRPVKPTDRVTPHHPTASAIIVVDINAGVEDVHVSAVPVEESRGA